MPLVVGYYIGQLDCGQARPSSNHASTKSAGIAVTNDALAAVHIEAKRPCLVVW